MDAAIDPLLFLPLILFWPPPPPPSCACRRRRLGRRLKSDVSRPLFVSIQSKKKKKKKENLLKSRCNLFHSCREATVSLHCVCFSIRPRYLVPNWVHQRLFFFLTLSRVITQRNNKAAAAAAVAAVALESSVILKGFFLFLFFLSSFGLSCVCVSLEKSVPLGEGTAPLHLCSVSQRMNKHKHTHTKERQKHWICRAPQSFFSTSSSPCDFVCLWKDETKKFKYSNNNKKETATIAAVSYSFLSFFFLRTWGL